MLIPVIIDFLSMKVLKWLMEMVFETSSLKLERIFFKEQGEGGGKNFSSKVSLLVISYL